MTILRKGLRDQTPEAETFGIDEALAKIATQLMEGKGTNILSTSDCTPEEVFGLSYILSLARKLDSNIMEEWVVDFLRLRISRLRMGRKELIILGSGVTEQQRRGKANVGDLFQGLR